MPDPSDTGTITFSKKILSAVLFFGSTNLFIFVMKALLPVHYELGAEVFGVSELSISLIIQWLARCVNLLQFPTPDRKVVRRIYPLLLLTGGFMATNLNYFGIAKISIYNMPRRLVILNIVTMLLEYKFLEVQTSGLVKSTISVMIVGTLIGGTVENNTFATYIIVVLNYCFSAATRVYCKKILDSRELGVSGLVYYITIILLIPQVIIGFYNDRNIFLDMLMYFTEFKYWGYIVMTALIGTMITRSAILCTQYNGALTTTIIGSLIKTSNTVISYVQLMNTEFYDESSYDDDDDDYKINKLSWYYWLGWSIIIVASLVYLYVIFKPNFASNNALVNTDALDIT